MGNASSKKKDEGGGGRRPSVIEIKFVYIEYVSREPSDVGASIPNDHIFSLVSRLLRDEDVTVKRALIYCNYILSGKD